MLIYIFLDHRNTNGNRTIREAIIEIKATFREEFNSTYEIINAVIPIATFSP
jgi:hypothetical protein